MVSESGQPLIGKMVGARIREVRRAKKLTQSQLAGEDFSVSYISAIERGQIHPSLRALEIFAQRLGLSSKDLLLASVGREYESAGQGESDKGETDWQLLIAHILLLQGAVVQAIQSLQQLLLKSPNTTQKVCLYYLLAVGHARLNQWQESDHLLSEAARLIKDSTSELAIKIQLLQGIIQAHVNSYNQGLGLLQQSSERLAAEPFPDVFLKAEVYAQLGYQLLQLERIEEARALFTAALQLTEALTPLELAAQYAELSKQQLDTQEPLQAAIYAYKSLRLHAVTSAQARHSELHHMLGRALARGNRNQAMTYLANTLAELPNDPLAEASAHVHLAMWELDGDNVAGAKNHAKQAHALLFPGADSLIAADALLALGKVEYAQKRYKAGDPYFEAGLAMLERLDAREDLAEQFADYARLLENRGDWHRAIEYLRKAYETRRKINR